VHRWSRGHVYVGADQPHRWDKNPPTIAEYQYPDCAQSMAGLDPVLYFATAVTILGSLYPVDYRLGRMYSVGYVR